MVCIPSSNHNHAFAFPGSHTTGLISLLILLVHSCPLPRRCLAFTRQPINVKLLAEVGHGWD